MNDGLLRVASLLCDALARAWCLALRLAVQLGHTDGGALVMSTYGHPTEEGARERLKRAYGGNVAAMPASAQLQRGSKAS